MRFGTLFRRTKNTVHERLGKLKPNFWTSSLHEQNNALKANKHSLREVQIAKSYCTTNKSTGNLFVNLCINLLNNMMIIKLLWMHCTWLGIYMTVISVTCTYVRHISIAFMVYLKEVYIGCSCGVWGCLCGLYVGYCVPFM